MIVRAQISWQVGTAFPRDAVCINPHFNFTQVGSSPDFENFGDDLLASMVAFGGGNKETRVKLSDAQGTPPVAPEYDKADHIGQNPEGGAPNEVALCLSYYAGQNTPRRRGRLYVPFILMGSSAPWRPTGAHLDKVETLPGLLAGSGGADVDWVVYSRVDDAAHTVTNYWIDDEWDTMRSRGGRATTRRVGTTGG